MKKSGSSINEAATSPKRDHSAGDRIWSRESSGNPYPSSFSSIGHFLLRGHHYMKGKALKPPKLSNSPWVNPMKNSVHPSTEHNIQKMPSEGDQIWSQPSKGDWIWSGASKANQIWSGPSKANQICSGPSKANQIWSGPSEGDPYPFFFPFGKHKHEKKPKLAELLFSFLFFSFLLMGVKRQALIDGQEITQHIK